MGGLLQDLRYALRQLRKNPGFTTVAVLTLALGIGANTAIFSVVNSVLINPLPYRHPEQLVQIFETTPQFPRNPVSGGAFKDWHQQSSKFTNLAIFEKTDRNLTGIGTPQRVSGLMVSSEFLSVLQVAPSLGRSFAVGEDRLGGDNHLIILTDQLWRERFGGNADIVGRTIALDQVPYTVIGVLPPHALLQDDAMFLVPDVIDAPGINWTRAGHWRRVVGRIPSGVTVSDLQTELTTIRKRLASEYPAIKKDWGVVVVPMREVYAGDTRPVLFLLLGTVALVLLIACANVANLLLARGNARAKEMAIRAALGAHSWQMLRQLLVESLLLAMVGCTAGLVFASVGIKFLASMFADMLPQLLQPTLDVRVLLFSIAVSCISGLLFGILPALRSSNPELNHTLKETGRSSTSGSRKRSQSFLVVSEFALTLMLLVGAGLLLRSFVRVLNTDPGFNPRQTLAFDLSFPESKYPKASDRMRLIKNLTAHVAALPGVDSAGASSALPFGNGGLTEFASRADKPARTDYLVACNFVSGNYFSAMGMPLLRGRAINDSDSQDKKVARVLVVDETLARDLYPNEDPIGRYLNFLGESWQIVGTVASVHQFVMDQKPIATVYGPQGYAPMATSIVVRTAQAPTSLIETARKAILDVDPDQPIADIRT
ncbi:MAG TPA: ABC transporter permease, partial [Terriglobales bacterium]